MLRTTPPVSQCPCCHDALGFPCFSLPGSGRSSGNRSETGRGRKEAAGLSQGCGTGASTAPVQSELCAGSRLASLRQVLWDRRQTVSQQSGEWGGPPAGLTDTRHPHPGPRSIADRPLSQPAGLRFLFSAQVPVPVPAEKSSLSRETQGRKERAHRLPGEQQPRRQQEADPVQVGSRRLCGGLALTGCRSREAAALESP